MSNGFESSRVINFFPESTAFFFFTDKERQINTWKCKPNKDLLESWREILKL